MSTKPRLAHYSGMRLLYALIAGIIAWQISLAFNLGQISLLVGWDVAALFFIIWTWAIIWPMNHEQTARFALREDPSRVGADIILILASIASLGAVAAALFLAHGTTVLLHAALLTITSFVSVILSWVLIHTVYTLRYARYYYERDGTNTVVFEKDHDPTYSDFAYLAFTLGMTFQVSDTNIVGTKYRKTVLRHVLLSYIFGTVILATTVSLLSGLGR